MDDTVVIPNLGSLGRVQETGPRYELMWVPVDSHSRVPLGPGPAYPYLPYQSQPSLPPVMGYNPYSHSSMMPAMMPPNPYLPYQHAQSFYYSGVSGPFMPYEYNQSMFSWSSTKVGGPQPPFLGGEQTEVVTGSTSRQSGSCENPRLRNSLIVQLSQSNRDGVNVKQESESLKSVPSDVETPCGGSINSLGNSDITEPTEAGTVDHVDVVGLSDTATGSEDEDEDSDELNVEEGASPQPNGMSAAEIELRLMHGRNKNQDDQDAKIEKETTVSVNPEGSGCVKIDEALKARSPLILRIPLKNRSNGDNLYPQVLCQMSDEAAKKNNRKRKSPDVTTTPDSVKPEIKRRVRVNKDSEKKMPKGEYACGICGKIYCYNSQLKVHKKCHELKKCNRCDESFMERDDLYQHLKDKHPDQHKVRKWNPQHKCTVCSSVFATQSLLTTHRSVHNAEGKYSCSFCCLVFWHWQSRRAHMKKCFKAINPLEVVDVKLAGGDDDEDESEMIIS